MTEQEFRIAFSRAVAEDDTPLCEATTPCKNADCPCDLTNTGLDNLTNIAEAVAEPLFDEIKDLKEKLSVDEGEFIRLCGKIAKLEAQLDAQNIRANERVADALKDRADMVDRAVAAEAQLREAEARAAINGYMCVIASEGVQVEFIRNDGRIGFVWGDEP